MNHSHLLPSLSAGLLLSGVMVATALPGCGQDKRGFAEPGPREFPTADSGSDASRCFEQLRCSRDLKKVLQACDDSVVEECGPDSGCGEGRCVDACTAAELSKGSAGCAFAALPPDETSLNLPFGGSSNGSCFAAMISNTWDRSVTISAALGDAPLDISRSIYTATNNGETTTYTRLDGPLPPKQVALVFLSQSPHEGRGTNHTPCPAGVIPAFDDDPILHGTTKTRAFRLTTDAPVSAYSIYPYGGAATAFPTATLLLPLSSWDTNYVGMTSWNVGSGRHVLQIVAANDGTEVRARFPGAGDVSERWTLNRNEVAQITEGNELSGTFIEADKPIGLFGGAECSTVLGSCCCDVLQQQIPALSQWGNEYALVPYRPRTVLHDKDDSLVREDVPWRLVGAVAGTVLTYDPEPPNNAPLTLEAGEAVSFSTTKLVTVKSQDRDHPFLASVFMTSATYPGRDASGGESTARATLGDPDFVTVTPTDQFLDRYVFFADHTYPDTTLTIVRRKTATGFHPVSLDCAGEITSFRPLGNAGEYEYAWVYLTSGFAAERFPGGECTYGRNEARSDGPFSLTVWGTGPYASYGFAGGAGSRPLSTVRVPVPK
jgi:IgGFc binding protein